MTSLPAREPITCVNAFRKCLARDWRYFFKVERDTPKVSISLVSHSCLSHVWKQPRILDILILQDKTLFCACVDNFKQNGGFWRHCACANNFKQNGVFWRQHLPIVRVWTWPKYNKHHHDLKKQLCRFIDMYIRKFFLADGTMSRMPRKRDLGTGLGRVRFVFWLRRD